MGLALSQARGWRVKRSDDISAIDGQFIDQSTARESKAKTRARRVQALVYVLFVGIILALIGVINEAYIKEQVTWYRTIRPYRVANVDPYVLRPETERALKPGDTFRECANDCPEMVVVPAGEFMMGSPANEKSRYTNEDSQHKVTIERPFAVSRFEATFADWDACASIGGCPKEGGANDAGWGRGKQPVIYVSWDLAKAYAAWLSTMTGKVYRLLTEAEWEYAARGGTTTAYFWGDEIGKDHTNCRMCGSRWDGRLPAPVGSFASNAFGLYDMHGNVWEWVEDCYHVNYNGAPTDGSAWTREDCARRVVRGGSWDNNPNDLRSASRVGAGGRSDAVGFRLGRTLAP